ncbi:MAG: aa3-type cytochrome c oxidase subunit IV [Paracoccus sp. (in: a-proteobacteria)]
MAENDTTEYQHGTMDVREHQRMFAAFIRFSTWFCILAAIFLIFLALSNA